MCQLQLYRCDTTQTCRVLGGLHYRKNSLTDTYMEGRPPITPVDDIEIYLILVFQGTVDVLKFRTLVAC